jgi:hypothetical protein
MAAKGKVLVLVSSGYGLPLKDGKVYAGAGYYLNELTVPVRALMQEGYEITFANPKGIVRRGLSDPQHPRICAHLGGAERAAYEPASRLLLHGFSAGRPDREILIVEPLAQRTQEGKAHHERQEIAHSAPHPTPDADRCGSQEHPALAPSRKEGQPSPIGHRPIHSRTAKTERPNRGEKVGPCSGIAASVALGVQIAR